MCKDVKQMVAAQSKFHKVIKIQALVRCWLVRRKYKCTRGILFKRYDRICNDKIFFR